MRAIIPWPLLLALAAAPLGAAEIDSTNTIVVTATRSDARRTGLSDSVTVMTREQIAHSSAGTADDLLRQIPGFSTFRRSSSVVTPPAEDPEAQGVTLRGIGPGGASHALVLVDGVPVNDGFGGWIYWGEIPVENVERIEIVKGGSSSLWGNFALAGVINIITRVPGKPGVSYKVAGGNRGTADGVLTATERIGPGLMTVEGDYFRTDGWNIVAPAQRGPIDHDAESQRHAFGGRYDWSPTSDLTLHAQARHYVEIRDAGTAFRSANAFRDFFSFGGTLHSGDSDVWKLATFGRRSAYNQHFSEGSPDRTFETPTQLQGVPSHDLGAALTWTRAAGKEHSVTVGVDYRRVTGESRDCFFDPTGAFAIDNQIAKGKQYYKGLFAEDVFRPQERLAITLSLREDWFENEDASLFDTPVAGPATLTRYPDQSRSQFSPKLSARYELDSDWAVRGAVYRAFRAPTLAELYRQSSVEDLVLKPNANLAPETLDGHEIGFEYTGSKRFDARVTAFSNDVKNPIATFVSAVDPATGDDAERTRVNFGLNRIRGIESDMKLRLSDRFTLEESSLFVDARVVDSPPDPTLVGARLTQVPFTQHTLGLRFTSRDRFSALLQGRYAGDQFEDPDNRDKLGGYMVVDFSVSRKMTSNESPFFNEGEVFLAVQNLLDRQYDVDRGGGILKIGTPLLAEVGVRSRF